jgi:anthranilate/para-aminobenzoate synthase component II
LEPPPFRVIKTKPAEYNQTRICCQAKNDGVVKSPGPVIPAKAGIYNVLKLLDSADASLRVRLSPE